ncbi:hypothetical protein ACHAXR_011069, partial [Thalassiosira sp. AJA248-18]
MNRQSSDASGEGASLPRIPKKKKFTADDNTAAADASSTKEEPIVNNAAPTTATSSNTEGGDANKGENKAKETDIVPKKAGRPPKSKAFKPIASKNNLDGEKFDPPILRKGDLVRLSNEQKSGRIQGGLARIARATHPSSDNEEESYDIEYVLGGKVSNLKRCDLSYTTATAEGLVDATDNSRGRHHLRKRRSTMKKAEAEAAAADSTVPPAAASAKRKAPGRPPGRKAGRPKKEVAEEESAADNNNKKSKKDKSRKSDHLAVPSTTAAKKRRSSTKSSDTESTATATASEIRSQAAKAGWEKRRKEEAAKAAKNPANTKPSSSKSSSASNSKQPTSSKNNANNNAKSSSTKANAAKEQQPSSKRGSSKKRNSATSTNDATSDSDAAQTDDTGDNRASSSRRMDMYTRHRRELDKSFQRLEKVDRFGFFLDGTPTEFDENYDDGDGDGDDDAPASVGGGHKAVQFPDQPPFNFLVLRKRFAAGRYDLDMVALEQKRLREIKAVLDGRDEADEKDYDDDIVYDELANSMCHPIAVDWETFNADVIAMCDAAMIRDPDGVAQGSGHLGWAAHKIKKTMEEIYSVYGYKRKLEVLESETRAKYDKVLMNCGNIEAAMQGKWRKEAFPERKYERLETSSVICDGLSPKDRSYAMYELETKLPDSFVGLAYTYDDSGQHSETWMKTVADETTKPQKSKSSKKKKKDGGDDTDSVARKNELKAQKAAMALAKDDGVVRAQVQTTMTTMLIQVQDRVMTDLGVMHNPEARSANWDDGDHGRDYRGGGAEVEQGTRSGFSLPEVAEQEVWGIDCYTRKNVMDLIESEFTPEIAIEFVEKWLLPAINACPVDLAHKMSTAARILEGLQPIPVDEPKIALSDNIANSLAEDGANTSSEAAALSSDQQRSEKLQEDSVFLRNAIESKVKEHGPPWLKAAARLVLLASDSMDDDFFRIHPKGHGSVVIGGGGLKANSLVTYYRGEVYPAWRWCEKLDAIEHVQKQLDLRPNLPDFYNMAMERPKKDPRGYCLLFVDASRKSGLGSSFSHSCNPTCEVRVVSLNGKLSLSMTTLRDLEQGEELTFDYNAVTESLNEYRFAVCLCGQKNCRGSFLHFATADCYQQVLSRNSPMSARFANLVRGCMKQVMSKEDSELLLKHGFNTAAFGAVSFNHHVSNVDPQSSPDSIENVPIWLRTFVADCLRYIEYERRALPVALLCNQMERMEQKQKKAKSKAPVTKKEKLAPSSESTTTEKSKAIAGSKPKTSYFFYLQSQRSHWEKIARQENGPELKGLEFSQAINKLASRAWNNLTEEEKQSWKKKSIADWKKNGGKEKAKLEEERQRSLKKASKETAKTLSKQNVEAAANDEVESKENNPSSNNDVGMEAKTISFADADAEGFSAMEQRIQQLAQSLSRIGRVLDRHRESVFEDMQNGNENVNSDLLRKLIPSPLKIMSDSEVVSWLWSDSKGVVQTLLSMVKQHFPEHSLLRELLSSTKAGYPVLSAFSRNYFVPSLEKKWKHSCTSSDARRLVREALLKFRSNIIEFLSFAEESNADVRNEKRREQARAREEKKKEQNRLSDSGPSTQDDVKTEGDTANGDMRPQENGIADDQNISQGFSLPDTNAESVEDRSNIMGDEAMLMRGGGGECASSDPPNGLFDSQILDQTSTLKPVGLEPSNAASVGVNNGIVLPPSDTDAINDKQPATACASNGQPSVCEDVESLLQLSKAANIFGKVHSEGPASSHDGINLSEDSASGHDGLSCYQNAPLDFPAKETNHSPSKFQDLIDAAASNKGIGLVNTLAPKESPILPLSAPLTAGLQDPTNSATEKSPILPLSAPLSAGIQGLNNSAAEIKKIKKKVVPLSEDQVKYLKDWLNDPKHVLNPYPTDEEKALMMKDIGIERKRLDGWFMKNRQRVLYPEVKPVKMKWRKKDQDHWVDFRKNRYMLEATADLLLMYASTNTFFLLEPFRQFDSTPIEVYARELGNQVPRHFAFNSQKSACPTPEAVDSNGDVSMEKSCCDLEIEDKTKTSAKIVKDKKESADDLCSPDDVIDKVTVDYSGEYVLSQLLQWVNGGIGKKKGLPAMYGCVMLPPIPGCWEEVKCNEVKLPGYTKWNRKTTTEYDANVRSKLAKWIVDRYQRGSPWDEELANYFCPQSTAADPTLPMGSPIIDYLVTGIDDNIRACASALSGSAKATEEGRTKLSATDRLQSTVDEGMPAQAVANWVQCENPNCLKWRKLPWHVDVDLLPENFFCKDNVWNRKSQTCDASEDEWDMEDAPIKFDTKDYTFEVGVWFDVQREGKVGYHEAQVVDVDFKSNVKRVKFHFWRLGNDRDEWIDVGSPKIAPHHSYTPRPLEGYKAPKEKKNSEKTKDTSSGSSATLPQKRKKEHLSSSNSSEHAEGTTDEHKKTLPFPPSTIDYLNAWISKHAADPFPTTEEKAIIVSDTGLSIRQVGDWMARARKKLRKKPNSPNKKLVEDKGQQPATPSKPSTDVATVKIVKSSPTKVENLLLELRNQGSAPSASTPKAVPASKVEQVAIKVNSPASVLTETGGVKGKTTIRELEAYMNLWLSRPENVGNLMPSLSQKERIIQETGIEKKRLEG